MSSKLLINVAMDFHKYPFGRFRETSPHSAQAFLEDLLLPALDTFDKVTVDLTYARALGSSFLEGVFGELIRKKKWSVAEFYNRIEIVSDLVPTHKNAIERYVIEASVTK